MKSVGQTRGLIDLGIGALFVFPVEYLLSDCALRQSRLGVEVLLDADCDGSPAPFRFVLRLDLEFIWHWSVSYRRTLDLAFDHQRWAETPNTLWKGVGWGATAIVERPSQTRFPYNA